MNNKGFTLIELLATIMLLAIISSVATVSVVSIIKTSKQRSYDILIDDIKIGAQAYFEECENVDIMGSTTITCPSPDISGTDEKKMTFELQKLLDYGFLTSTATIEDASGNEIKVIKNPITDENMNDCEISVLKYKEDNNWWYEFETASIGDTTCPTNDDYSS